MKTLGENGFRLLKRKEDTAKCAVSVIIPVYNVANYLSECLESVQKQSLKEIEIICVDDGSTDDSLNILLDYAEKDHRISVYTQENAGLSITRNHGASMAEGEYLYFLDSDDIIETFILEVVYNRAKADALDLIFFSGTAFGGDNEVDESIIKKYEQYYVRKNDYPGIYTGGELLCAMEENREYRVSCGMHLIRADYFKKKGLGFEKGIVYEDNLYMMQAVLNAERAGYAAQIGYRRRLRKNSIVTSQKTFIYPYSYFIDFIKMSDFIQKKHLDEKIEKAAFQIVQRLLQNARREYSELELQEQSKAENLTAYERVLFQAYIIDWKIRNDLKSRAEKEKQALHLKLQQTYEEKSELNTKLQQTYEEKSELNTKLQQTYQEKSELNAKLQQTYEEKSELNAKLQQTYREKRERGEIIQEQKEQIGTLQKKLEQQQKQMEKLEKNIGVRIAKKLKK